MPQLTMPPKEGHVRKHAVLVTVLMMLAIGLPVACDGGDGSPNGAAGETPSSGRVRVSSLSEGQSLLPFDVTLPSFVPVGTSDIPELVVIYREDDTPYLLEAIYWERSVSNSRPLRMRIREAAGRASVTDNVESETVRIREVQVEFAAEGGNGDARAIAAWSHAGTGYQVEFLWLSDGETNRLPEDEVRAEALKVIESMIE